MWGYSGDHGVVGECTWGGRAKDKAKFENEFDVEAIQKNFGYTTAKKHQKKDRWGKLATLELRRIGFPLGIGAGKAKGLELGMPPGCIRVCLQAVSVHSLGFVFVY